MEEIRKHSSGCSLYAQYGVVSGHLYDFTHHNPSFTVVITASMHDAFRGGHDYDLLTVVFDVSDSPDLFDELFL